MNKRRDLPPPIIFSLKYMDQTPAINNLVKLKSKKPYGMNKRLDLPPPIIFSLKYVYQTPVINNLVKLCYRKLQTSSGNQSGIPMARQLICTSKRNRNLRDMLVKATHL